LFRLITEASPRWHVAGAEPHCGPDREKRLHSDGPSPESELKSSVKIVVAHFDHLLRGEESGEDARFVERLATRYGLQFVTGSGDVLKKAKATGRSIEDMARELRYAFLTQTAYRAGVDRIATGHTITDQAETLLMRLVRGAGTHGLAAMRPVSPVPARGMVDSIEPTSRDESASESGPGPGERLGVSRPARERSQGPTPLLVRPILCLTREEVEDYCRDRGLEFRIDPSNLTLDYTRNRIRHSILHELRALNPKIEESLARASDLFAADDDALQLVADSALKNAIPGEAERKEFDSIGARPFWLREFLSQAPSIARRMIIGAVKMCNEGSQLSMAHVLSVQRLMHQARSGSRVLLPGEVEVWLDRDFVVFKPRCRLAYQVELDPRTGGIAKAGGFSISIDRGLPIGRLDELMHRAVAENEGAGKNWMSAILDDDQLPASLLVRTRRRGEKAQVYGQHSVKKLKILMIGHRIPVSRRLDWPVVASADGRYIWSPELPPAIELCARTETRGLAVLRARISRPTSQPISQPETTEHEV
ncbi:MAG TPA: tRNA lysidine(34) synthetase TilS, partial [Blastocatellia bacterium]|nr:tRNA lysidine(34) synthetase TilS [Blastocatellia bacterium]